MAGIRDLKKRREQETQFPDIDPRFLFINTGFNLRPTELNAAFGLIQLPKLDAFNQRRKQIVSFWNERFSPLIESGLFRPMRATTHADVAWFGYPVICKDPRIRAVFRDHLHTNGIDTRPIICGNIARQPALAHVSHRISRDLKCADRIMDCGLLWAAHPLLTDEKLDYLARVVLGLPAQL